MARIAIVGPGAVGGIMAAWLARGGTHEVIACARRPLGEFTVETMDETFTARPRIVTQPAEAPPVDFVLVATKTYDVAPSAAWLGPLCAAGAPVAVLQNGVEHRERFAAHVPAERIVPVLVYCPAERAAPTQFRMRRKSWLVVPDDAAGAAFAALFAGTPIEVQRTPDWTSEAWKKLVMNTVGVLNALLLQGPGVFRDARVAELARAMMREAIAAGRAEGATLADTLPDEVLALYARNPPDTVNSLHADWMAKRPTEVDARNGVVVRAGRKHGIPTPLNAMALTLVEGAALRLG